MTSEADREFFPTDDWAADALFEHWRPEYGTWLEPCVGDGSIVAAAQRAGIKSEWVGIDIHPYALRPDVKLAGLYLQSFKTLGFSGYEAVVTNPPFTLARDLIEKCLIEKVPQFAILVRVTFLGSKERAPLFQAHPPNLIIHLPKRFRGPNHKTGGMGTDNVERVWLVWDSCWHLPGTSFVFAAHPDA